MELPVIKEKEYLNLFKISIFMKAITAFMEMCGGILIWFTSKIFLITLVLNLFKSELSDEPNDLLGNFIVNSAADFSISSQYFFGAYLFLHGTLKIFLIINLFRRKIWAYPATIIIFSLLIAYQLYRYFFSHSMWVLAFTLFDILIVFLTIHEYGVLRKKNKRKV